ncbi:hypothetical protein K7432_016478, partial [Basidiobolus ranarum]
MSLTSIDPKAVQPPSLFLSLSDLKNPEKSGLHRDDLSFDRHEDVTNKVPYDFFPVKPNQFYHEADHTDPNQYLHDLDDDSYELKEAEEELLSAQKTVQAQHNLITVTSAQLVSKEQEFATAQHEWRRKLIQAQADIAAKDVQIKELERQLADAYAQLAMATGKSMMQILRSSESLAHSPP